MAGFPITLATPPEHTGPLPEAVDVTVIGGGIIGVMTAWELARAGLHVLLCEKGRLAGEQSGRNWGWLRQQGRDLAELPIMIEALRCWRELPQGLRHAIRFERTGITYLARDEVRMARFESWLAKARLHGVDSRLLSRREIAALLPGNEAGWIGALHTPSDAQAEPFVAVPVLARAAVAAGVIIREHCAVRGLELAAGHISGVMTEAGPVRCERVLLAGGAWSSLFLAAHGVRLPQLGVVSTVATTDAQLPGFTGAAADNRFAIGGRAGGAHTLTSESANDFFIGPDAFRNLRAFWRQFLANIRGTKLRPAAPRAYPDAWRTRRHWKNTEQTPFERCRILDPRPNATGIARVQEQFQATFPDIGKPRITASWAGMIDVMPDLLPVVDHAPISGLIIATGMSGHGFGIAPGMAKVLVDLVRARPPRHEISAFRFDRFRDGTRPKVSSAIR